MRTYRSGTLLKDETLAEAPVWLRDKSLKWHLIQYVSVSNQHATHLKLIQYDNDYLRRAGFGGRGENGTWLRSGKSMLCKSTNCQKKKKKTHWGRDFPLFCNGRKHSIIPWWRAPQKWVTFIPKKNRHLRILIFVWHCLWRKKAKSYSFLSMLPILYETRFPVIPGVPEK